MSYPFKLKLQCLSDKENPEIFLIFNCFSGPLSKVETWHYKNLKVVSQRFLDR